jgi:hypothetical protein
LPLLCALVAPAWADEGPADPNATAAAKQFAAALDQLLDERMREANVTAAPMCDDGEFVRRVYLDLVGVVPRYGETRDFLADQRGEKRDRLIIELLLDKPRHATHLANTWRQFMLPGNVDLEDLQSVAGVQNWLRRQFSQNLRYDRIVSDFWVAQRRWGQRTRLVLHRPGAEAGKAGEQLRRVISLDCTSNVHNATNTRTINGQQQDFWSYAAFFAQLERGPAMDRSRSRTAGRQKRRRSDPA